MSSTNDVIRDDLDCERWSRALLTLSLPRAWRFLAEMGFPAGPVSGLRGIAEDGFRRLDQATGSDRVEECRRVLDDVLSQVVNSSGIAFKENLEVWVGEAFPRSHARRTQPFLWIQVLRRAAESARLSLSDVDMSPHKRKVVADAVLGNIGNTKTIGDRIREADQEPRTPWESAVYSAYLEGASPLDYVSEAVLGAAFWKIWRSVRGSLSDDEIRSVVEWAKQGAQEMGIPADLLHDPGALL